MKGGDSLSFLEWTLMVLILVDIGARIYDYAKASKLNKSLKDLNKSE